MIKTRKELIKDIILAGNPDPGSGQIRDAAKFFTDTEDGNSKQAQFANLQELERRFQTVVQQVQHRRSGF